VTTTVERARVADVGGVGGAGRFGLGSRSAARLPHPVLVAVLAVVAVLARLPGVTRPMSNDEGGFLMVAAQWAPGSSLYGNYWVDRPPLIIGLFQLADELGGGPVALRLLAAAWVGASVVLAAFLARVVGRAARPAGRAVLGPAWAAAVAAVFLVTPLFDPGEVDGELLAVPFLLAGIIAVLKAHLASTRRSSLAWWALAGGLAVAAAAVKQNMLEVFVAAAVVLVARLRQSPAQAGEGALGFVGGVTIATAALLGWAAYHGTSLDELWDAIVTFRFEASAVIAHSAPDSASDRFAGVAGAFLVSGALALVVLAYVPRLVRGGWRPRWGLVRIVAAAVLVWEAVAVAAGGSYWLHYLVGTVPGLVLAVAAAPATRLRRLALGGVLAYAAVMAAAGVVTTALAPIGTPSKDLAVEHYLAAHKRPGDTGVIAYGDPVLLQAAGLSSPYPELWSLPVRVRDSRLTQLTQVLSGRSRPTWVIVSGDSLATWGVDPSLAQPVLVRDYRPVQVFGDWHVFHVRAR
jgi:hypothetical protein